MAVRPRGSGPLTHPQATNGRPPVPLPCRREDHRLPCPLAAHESPAPLLRRSDVARVLAPHLHPRRCPEDGERPLPLPPRGRWRKYLMPATTACASLLIPQREAFEYVRRRRHSCGWARGAAMLARCRRLSSRGRGGAGGGRWSEPWRVWMCRR